MSQSQILPKDSTSNLLSAIEFKQANQWVNESGQEYTVIDNLQELDPFFLNIVGASNHWLFCSSDGALTAGRESADTALFPYYTVDKIIGNWNTTGPWTAIVTDGKLWNPFRPSIALLTPTQRRIMKSLPGDEVVFDELHRDLGLRFTYRWQFSRKYGFVRTAKISNVGPSKTTMRLVDGLDNFLPAGVESRLQLQYSCLADAYKVSELECDNSLLIHRLAAGITDEPIPLESMRATTVWTHGLGPGATFLERRQAESFLRGHDAEDKPRTRAKRGAFLLARELTLEPGESREWTIVAEIEQTQSEVSALARALKNPLQLLDALKEDIAEGRKRLTQIVAATDGFQQTADRDIAHYHYHNALCNIMRGGIPENGYTFQREQFISYLSLHNRPLATAQADWLANLPRTLNRRMLLAAIETNGNPDLLRLAEEYLPLVLSRRHGDPSRPWNQFFIRVDDEEDNPIHYFEGNWRDIFQNWEALALSYPDFLGSFITKFLNASTIDGFNPYRITSAGIDWEAPDPDDPWASIGYWGDHQIVYLLKLLELKAKVRPESLGGRLDSQNSVFAAVPYRLKGWEDTLRDPRDTVEFDLAEHEALMARKEKLGGDGLLLRDEAGELVRVTLLEKLLLPAAVKLANLIPGGGVWMNTQRPEWNDANNAIAGYGLSVVTAGYLYRYLGLMQKLVSQHPEDTLILTSSFAGFLENLGELFADERWLQKENISPKERFALVKAAGLAAESHRANVYQNGPGEATTLPVTAIRTFLTSARAALKNTLAQNRRSDGLWHSYNILNIQREEEQFEIEHLTVMLEGQVSILSSGLLESGEALELLETLPESPLRSDRHPTYLLYPDREVASFLEGNRVPANHALAIPLLQEMDRLGDNRILVPDPDPDCDYRFHPSLVNSYALDALFKKLEKDAWLVDQLREDRDKVAALYEATFNHRSFTGRSGSMFGYEGLGCVYWHMVSKLMVASQEIALNAARENGDADTFSRLAAAYYHVQSGLGFRQSPEGYGAFPSEPYSHSPGHAGAQQPGLTGQVKEGILARFGELGVSFQDGRLHFRPRLLREAEFAGLPASKDQKELPVGTLAFTFAQTPIVYRRKVDLDQAHAQVFFNDGTDALVPKAELNQEMTLELIQQTKRIEKIEVYVPASWLIS